MTDDLKQRIIETSFSLFLRHGIKSITMDFIAAQMGISKRTLYEAFKDKNQLLIECLTWNRHEIERQARAFATTADNSLVFLLEVFMIQWRRMRNVNRNYFSDLKRYYPQVSRQFDDERVSQAEAMRHILEQGQAEGMILPDCRCDIVGQLLATKFDILFSLDEVCSVEFTFMDAFVVIFKTFIRGIATPKGIEIIEGYFKGNVG
ncbi:MAG: TetR/AcrR family transcriptional regulator [Porphyromonadaceae bacterium]|nr:TetR/AcrR family transcriptional regulator [Porphyromonadaceae bacterium]